MKQMLKLAAISMALIVNFGAANAQNMPTPKPEDAERRLSDANRWNKNAPAPTENKDRHPDANPAG